MQLRFKFSILHLFTELFILINIIVKHFYTKISFIRICMHIYIYIYIYIYTYKYYIYKLFLNSIRYRYLQFY
jgi:hypothetical protein